MASWLFTPADVASILTVRTKCPLTLRPKHAGIPLRFTMLHRSYLSLYSNVNVRLVACMRDLLQEARVQQEVCYCTKKGASLEHGKQATNLSKMLLIQPRISWQREMLIPLMQAYDSTVGHTLTNHTDQSCRQRDICRYVLPFLNIVRV